MATFKLKLLTKRAKKDGSYPLVFKIYHKNGEATLSTGVSIITKYWGKNERLSRKHPDYESISKITNNRFTEIEKAILHFEQSPFEYTAAEIKDYVLSPMKNGITFNEYGRYQIELLRTAKRYGNALTYETALHSLESFYGRHISFKSCDYKLISEYEVKLITKGLKTNAIGAYMRALRAIYNKAIREDLAEEKWYPFRKFKIRSEKTSKRSISIEEMRRIFALELPKNSPIWDNWNYFRLTFCLIGINFADFAVLKPENIQNGRLSYKRKKTGKLYDIKLTSLALEILGYYKGLHPTYLLPILPNNKLSSKQEIDKTKEKLKICNNYLLIIGGQSNLPLTLTTYVARHSWANLAKSFGYSNEVIAEALGHEYGNAVTGIYLDKFDSKVIDDVNERIQQSITD